MLILNEKGIQELKDRCAMYRRLIAESKKSIAESNARMKKYQVQYLEVKS